VPWTTPEEFFQKTLHWLLRGCWFWSKKLLFRKNFNENFNVVERVTSHHNPVKILFFSWSYMFWLFSRDFQRFWFFFPGSTCFSTMVPKFAKLSKMLWKFSKFWKIISVDQIHSSLPPPPNVIYSRFWYPFSWSLRKFHPIKTFHGNFCEPGLAWFNEKKMEFPSQDVSKRYSILFSAKFKQFSNPFRGRALWTCRMNLFMTWIV